MKIRNWILALMLSLCGVNVGAEELRISLLTCGAYDEVWALYGHSALRVESPETGEDFVINYGLFDFHQPNFVGRFLFGKCDYMMGFVPFDVFMTEFSSRGTSVYQQEINLTQEEKVSVLRALEVNALPENREYRYNFFYDNCATRPRDIILNNIPDKIVYLSKVDSTRTFRSMIHAYNEQQPWCRLGNDMLLGVGADRRTSRADQQFLPDNLKDDFANAQFVDPAGHKRPVVLTSGWILKGEPVYAKDFPLSPNVCGVVFLVVCIALCFYERKAKRRFWQLDAALLTVCGLLGVILFLMIFSEHPTVSVNLLILGLNPLLLVFWWRVVQELRGKKKPKVCRIYLACLAVSIVAYLLNFLPIQEIPTAMFLVYVGLTGRVYLSTK